MPEPGLSLGAHLLLWVFPLLLAAAVVLESLRGGRRREPER
jgi:cytochrome c-type biogenesis protein CcmH/NrfF